MKDKFLYNILWIDDEHEGMKGLKGRAKKNGLKLFAYKSENGGLGELEKNYEFYDGVLLDAKFFKDEDDVAGTEGTEVSHRAKERILRLPKHFEIFVLTGQAEAYDNKSFGEAFLKVYRKGTEDVERLFIDIKTAADNEEDTQVRQEHKRMFEVCTEKYIGEQAGKDLLKLLKAKDNNDFNKLRMIVEDIFIAFNKFGLLPKEFVIPQVSLNESSKFLTGENRDGKPFIEKGYEHKSGTHLPVKISDAIRRVLSDTQDGSHRASVNSHINTVQSPYLFNSTLNLLMEVIVWFKSYVDENPPKENWISRFSEKEELVKGSVINYNPQKGYAFFKPMVGSVNAIIPPNLVEENNLCNDMGISVLIESYIDNRDKITKQRVTKVLIT